MRRSVIAVGAVSLLLTAPASGRVVPLHWQEEHWAYGHHFLMTFRVTRLEIGRGRWSARVLVKNDTDMVLVVGPRFGLVVSGNAGKRTMPATSFAPALPTQLGFLAHWVGTIAGRGVPPNGVDLRLLLGSYHLRMAPNLGITHVTRHSLHWP